MNEPLRVPIWRVGGNGIPLPTYMTDGASGCDLAAAIAAPLSLAPLERALVPTGLAIALPRGFEAQVRPRSGLAIREGITVVNAPGTIDADYRGEIRVGLINLSGDSHVIQPGDRVAQLVVAPVARVEWALVDDPTPYATARASGGFGHTGKRGLPKTG